VVKNDCLLIQSYIIIEYEQGNKTPYDQKSEHEKRQQRWCRKISGNGQRLRMKEICPELQEIILQRTVRRDETRVFLYGPEKTIRPMSSSYMA
jgi:hypothetical protein